MTCFCIVKEFRDDFIHKKRRSVPILYKGCVKKMGQVFSSGASRESVKLTLTFDSKPEQDDEIGNSIYGQACKLIGKFEELGELLRTYSGNERLVRKSLSSQGNPEIERSAFLGMFPNIIFIKAFFDLSQENNTTVLLLLRHVVSCYNGDTFCLDIVRHTALLVKLACIFEV